VSENDLCIANISQRERRKRLFNGLIALSGGITLLALMRRFALGRGWRLILFAPLWVAASGFFQWQAKTCVRLAAQGLRQLSDQVEAIQDSGELAQVRHQARQVRIKTTVTAGILTLLALLLPQRARSEW
jgi:hypothetical protein